MTERTKDLGRPQGQPLQVYLDSSDYSVLGDAMEKPSRQHAETFRHLVELVDTGQIEVRFSGIHVVEISHIEAGARDAGLRRAKCIERLCKGKCFILFPDLLAEEQKNFEMQRSLYQGLTNDEGLWFSDVASEVVKTLRQGVTDGIAKVIKEIAPNREGRRKAEKRLVKNGILTPEAARLIAPTRQAALKEIADQFPLSERFFKEDIHGQFLTGQVSSAELIHELLIVLRDVEKFVGWTYDKRDIERKTVKWFRDLGAKIQLDVTGLRATLEPMIRAIPPAQVKSELDKLVTENVISMRPKLITSFAQREIDQAPIGELGDLPALDTFVSALGIYFKMSVLGNRNLLASDTGDLFHLAHAPYCDIFRADGNTSQIASQVLKPYATKVVPKLAQLSDALDAILQSRATNA